MESRDDILEDTKFACFPPNPSINSPILQQEKDSPLMSTSKDIDETSSDFEHDSADITPQMSSYPGVPHFSTIHERQMR